MLKKIAAAAGLTLAAAGVQAQQPPPAQPPAVCTRADLQAAVDGYVAAQKAGDASKLAFADKAVFKENMADVDKGDWLFNANAHLKYSSKEDWSAPKAAARVSGQELINAANSYLDMFSDKFVKTPWGRPCVRLEGGAYTNRDDDPNATCEVGIPAGVLYIVNRDYVVDEELGVINVFCRFGNSSTGMPDSHTFRLVSGKLSNVHTLSVNLNPDRPSPQADDNGAIVR